MDKKKLRRQLIVFFKRRWWPHAPSGKTDLLLDWLAEKNYAIEQDWQPIETAPTDGTPVLIYATLNPPENRNQSVLDLKPFYCVACYHPDAGWCVDEFREATHWRPLPAPPQTKD
jgi:hypothetical protein